MDWDGWLARWDTQQQAYLPDREERFTAMLDVCEALLAESQSESFVALDLACGPGAISQRLLARFPKARCVAVDLDPVLLALGQAVLGDAGGRLRWVDADLREPDWTKRLGESSFDAVLTTTALHWLSSPDVVALYRALAATMPEGGVLVNGDNFSDPSHQPSFKKLGQWNKQRIRHDSFDVRGREDWAKWWEAIEREPEMKLLCEERKRRFAWRTVSDTPPLLELHTAALRDAGFREVGVVWQHGDNRVLLAVR